jgi:hypothetical protein
MPIAVLYFFFNGFLLPLGLLYTTILTPLFLLWLFKYDALKQLSYFFIITIPFAIFHFINGVEPKYYLTSYILLFSVYVFGLSFYQFLKISTTLRSMYRNLLLINVGFFVLALIGLFIPALKEIFWFDSQLSNNIGGINRLRLFTYEPSYYSTLLVPIALYYYIKAIMNKLPERFTPVILISLPLILSFSMGVIFGTLLSILITCLLNARTLFSKQTIAVSLLGGAILLFVGLGVAFVFFPDNVFFQRISNVFEGRDSSFKGRTYDSFYLAWKVAEMKSIFFGCGLGQIKVVGLELWREYYDYKFSINEIAIPNVMGDTLAVFGLLGVAIRLFIQIFLFFKTRVYSNTYRLALFTFIFIYQFTGSYLYNIAEYVIWILAFTNVFTEFDKNKRSRSKNVDQLTNSILAK